MRKTSKKLTHAAVVAAAAVAGFGADAFAQQDTRAISSGNWSEPRDADGIQIPTRWDNGEPSSSAVGSFNGVATNAIINFQTITITEPGETALRVDLGTATTPGTGNTGTLVMNSGSLTINNPDNLPIGGTGALPSLRIGTSAGTTGTFTMTGGNISIVGPVNGGLAVGDVLLGDNGVGRMDMSGGTLEVSDEFILGTQAISTGNILNLSGGTISTNATTGRSVIAGFNGQGTINLSGNGSINSRNEFIMGLTGSSNGSFTIKDTATVSANVINIASELNTTGAGTQTGGTVTARSHFLIGRIGSGRYDHSAGAINVLTGNGDFVIGDLNGAGVGPGTGGRGIYNISGTATLATSDDLWVGNAGETDGRLNQTGGTITVGQTPAVGQDYLVARLIDSVGRVDHTAGGMTTSFLAVGNEGNGTYNLGGTGTVTSRRELIVGRSAIFVAAAGTAPSRTVVSNGTFTQSGTSTVTAALGIIGDFGNGTYQMNGGTLNVATAPATVGGAVAPLLLIGRDGGGDTNVGTGTLAQTAGTVNVGSATTVASVFLGDLNDSFGTYRISGGTLNVAGNLNVASALASNAAADNVRIEPTSATDAQGQATGVRGRFEVVGSAGDINVGRHLLANPANRSSFRSTPASSAEFLFEFVGNTISVIDVGGVADLDGAVIDIDNAVLTPESRVNLIIAQRGFANVSTVDATFGTTENAGTGEMFTLASDGDQATYRLDIVPFGTAGGEMLQVSAVPEPSALALLGLGGLGLLRRRRAVTA